MGSNLTWLGSLQEWEIRAQSLTEERLYEDTEMTIIYKPRREISEEMSPADTLILDFQPPELWEINACYLNHLMYGILLWQPCKTNMISNPSANSLDFNWKRITQIWSFSTTSYVPLILMSLQLFLDDLNTISTETLLSSPSKLFLSSSQSCSSKTSHGFLE